VRLSPLLPDYAASPSEQTVSNDLGNVTVTDGRGGTAGWIASAHGDTFNTSPAGSKTIPVNIAGKSSYTTPTATKTGTVTVTLSDLDPLSPGDTVQTATAVSGANTATWNPHISVTIPGGTQAGSYSSTVTHSVI
jgi:hypothetical protein